MTEDRDITPDHTDAQAPSEPADDLDPAPYLPLLDETDLTETQKHELLRVLWDMMSRFVELGFSGEASAFVLDKLFEDAGANGVIEVNLQSTQNNIGGDDAEF